MSDTLAPPSVRELFHKWQELLAGGQLSTASYIAGEQGQLVEPLQLLINEFISQSAHGYEVTLTGGPNGSVEPETPPFLPDYSILGPLGRGGMGDVFRVRDALDRQFALKLAHREQLSAAGRARFLDEAKTMAKLNHPNVARIHHYGLYGESPYFLMRVYPASLNDRLKEYQRDPRKAVRLMAEVAQGVGHLHGQGLIHRDLKPHNILLDDDGRGVVSDFGLVKGIADTSTDVIEVSDKTGSAETQPDGARRSRTVVGTIVGTRAYMAPEQAAGFTQLANPKWDVWSLGVILHQLLTGQFPPSSRAPERLLDPNEPDNPPPSTFQPGIDFRLERVILKCLARHESDRCADGNEVAKLLAGWLRRRERLRIAGIAIVSAILVLGAVLYLASSNWLVDPDPAGDPGTKAPTDLRESLVWRHGEPFTTAKKWPTDMAFTLDTQRQAAVEMVPPEFRSGAVRASGRVRINDRQRTSGWGGIFLGGDVVPTSVGDCFAFVEIGFCDDTTPPKDGAKEANRWGHAGIMARLLLVDSLSPQFPPASLTCLSLIDLPTPRPKRGDDEPFHDLVLEMSERSVEGSIDGRNLGKCDLSEVEAALTIQIEQIRGIKLHRPIRLQPGGGAGVTAMRASVSYSDFKIANRREGE